MADNELSRDLQVSMSSIEEDYRQIERRQLGPQEQRAERLVTKLRSTSKEITTLERTVRGFSTKLLKQGAKIGLAAGVPVIVGGIVDQFRPHEGDPDFSMANVFDTILQKITTGAALGSFAGPKGALVGAVAGAVTGIVSGIKNELKRTQTAQDDLKKQVEENQAKLKQFQQQLDEVAKRRDEAIKEAVQQMRDQVTEEYYSLEYNTWLNAPKAEY